MASITLSPASLVNNEGDNIPGVAGVVLAAGQFVYQDSTTRRFLLASAAAAATCDVFGMVKNSAPAIGQPIDICTKGLVTVPTAPFTAGLYYILSASVPGAVMPIADILSTNRNVLIGFALTTSILHLFPHNWGYTVP